MTSAPAISTSRPHSWAWRAVFAVGPDLIILILFTALLAVLTLAYDGRITFVQSSFLLPFFALVVLVGVVFATNIRKLLTGDAAARRDFLTQSGQMVRDWSPFVLIIFIYENLHELTYLIRPDVVDGSLRAIDEALFGVEPTLALQRITTPWLTELMTYAYALYFFYPVFLMIVAYRKGAFHVFREMMLALALCNYLGFLGYITVPAIGPRYFMSHEFQVPLDGIWLAAKAAAAWNAFENLQRDCFPSLHTALSTISLIYLWRLRRFYPGGRPILWVCAPLIVLLWLSTVYLRYHWTVDVLGGFVLAFLCTSLASTFIGWYYGKKLGRRVTLSVDEAAAARRA